MQVNISAKEQNRLAVEGRRLTSVVPSQKGVLTAIKDEEQGALYFTLASDSGAAGTITLFVSDDHKTTYKLILVPRPIAGEEIIIRPPAAAAGAQRKQTADGRTISYQRRIKDLILAMADEDLRGTVDCIKTNQDIPLWKEGHLVEQAKCMDGEYVGEIYTLTNVSQADMLLVEQELYRRGVLAVSIENHTLPMKESTAIYVVRGRKGNE